MRTWFSRQAARYALTALLVIAATVLALLLSTVFSASPYLAFYSVVVAAAALGGTGPGLLATFAAALSIDYFVTPPVGQLNLGDPAELTRYAIFIAGGASISIVGGIRRAALARQRRQAAETAELAELTNLAQVIVRDAEDRIIRWGEGCTRLYGFTAEQALGRVSHDLLQTTFPQPLETITATLRTEGRWEGELIHRRADGATVTVASSWTLRRSWNGDSWVVLEVDNDITGRKLAEAALRESEEKFRSLVENMRTAVGIVQGRRFVYANRYMAEMIGYSVAEILSMDFPPLVHPAYREIIIDRARRRQSGEPVPGNYEFLALTKSGEGRWIDIWPALISYHGKPAIIGAGLDVTQRKRAEAALQDSEEKFRTLADNMSQLAWMADEKGWIFWYNQRWFEYTGTDLEQVRGWGWQKVHHPDHIHRVVEKISRCFETGDFWEDTFPLRGKDGQYRWFLSRAVPIRDQHGKVVRWFGTSTDVTERLAAEANLAERARMERLRADAAEALQRPADTQALLQTVAALLTEGLHAALVRIWTLDDLGQTLELQASAGLYTHLDGVHSRIPVGQFQIGVIAQERRPHVTNRVLADPGIHDQEWARREGLVSFAAYPLLLEDRLLGVVAVFGRQELSPAALEALSAISNLLAQAIGRKQAEAALRESENEFREVFDYAPAGLIITDLQGRFLHVNPAFCEIVGYTRAELLGRPFEELMHPDDLLPTREAIRKLVSGAVPAFFLEKRYIRKDGAPVWVQVGCTLRRPDHKPSELVVIIENIDLRKRAESGLAAAKESAEQASRAKDHFLAVLSHELRTPLTPVLAGVSMLESEAPAQAETRQTLQMIHRNVELEARLIDDLLDLTRIARGKIELHKAPVDVCMIIDRAVEVCRPDIEARALHFAVETGTGAPYWVNADIGRMQQVIWNLLKNSIKFTPHGGCVGIRCGPAEDGFVLVEVTDSGEGIEPDALGRIFNAFEQAQTRRGQFGGLGLGLAISRALVELHGGTIEAYSAGKGKGATFRVRLPVVRSPLPVRGGQGPAANAPPAPGLRILLVEDHGDTAQIWKRLLERRGHEVQVAGDVATAFQIASSGQLDLIISDLGLPDGNGLDLMRQVRERGLDLKGIVLSGYGMERDVQRSRDAGFSEHLTKPVEIQQLQEAIQRVASETR